MNKLLLILLLSFSLCISSSCNKKNNNRCNTAVIVGIKCTNAMWNIKLPSGAVYHSFNVPQQFRQAGLSVCISYELYEDLTMCPCCGGTAIRVLSMSLPE